MAFPTRLREIREDRDLTQADVAKQLGIAQQQYQLYESGKRQMPIEKLIIFCRTYGVSSDYILELPKGLRWER